MEREETLTVNNSEYRNVDVTYWLSLSTEHPTQPSIQLVDHYTDSVDGDMGATRNAECDTVHHHDHHHISLSYQPSSPSSASPNLATRHDGLVYPVVAAQTNRAVSRAHDGESPRIRPAARFPGPQTRAWTASPALLHWVRDTGELSRLRHGQGCI